MRKTKLGIAALAMASLAAVVCAPWARSSDGGPTTPWYGQRRYAAGERLIAQLSSGVPRPRDERDMAPRLALFEAFPDGTVSGLPLRLPEHTLVRQLQPLPDGRLVVVGLQNLDRQVSYEDGPYYPGLVFPLMVVDHAGEVLSSKDIRLIGQHVDLLGVTATEAILVRYGPATADGKPPPARVVLHDLTSGTEKALYQIDGQVSHADAGGDWLALAGHELGSDPSGQCWVRFHSPPHSEAQRHLLPACERVIDLNVSPDGRFAAVAFERAGEWAEPRLRIVDTVDLSVYSDELLGDFLGMAWLDDHTLCVTRMEPLPLRQDGRYRLAQVQSLLRVEVRIVRTVRPVGFPTQ